MSFLKDPAAVLDYAFNWTTWLQGGDTISEAEVVALDGLEVVSQTYTASTVTAWVAGGEAGQSYTLTCRVTTVNGRTDERSMVIRCRER